MKKTKWNVSKSVEVVCKEIEEMISCVLATKPNKKRTDKSVIYYPARKFLGTDDIMDDVTITVRKVNNTLTNIRLENSEYFEKELATFGENWRCPILRKAYSTLENVLSQMYG